MSEFKTLSSKIVYENKWMKLREDEFEREVVQKAFIQSLINWTSLSSLLLKMTISTWLSNTATL